MTAIAVLSAYKWQSADLLVSSEWYMGYYIGFLVYGVTNRKQGLREKRCGTPQLKTDGIGVELIDID